jgi:uncharacterized protein (TIGR03437 family)
MHRLTSVVLGFLSAGWLSGEVPGARMVPQLAADSAGNVYVAGATTSPNLAVTPGALQPLRSGPPDAFVAKFSPSGALIYNAQMPDGIGASPASLVVRNANGTSAPFTLATAQRSPGLYAPAGFKSGGKQYVGAVLPDGARVGPPGLNPFYTFRPAQAGDHVAFFGKGFGPTIPPIPAGQVVSRTNSLPNVMVQFGGVSAAVEFSGEVQIGLYQINAIVPAGLSGDVLLTMTVDGVPVGQTLYITLQ